jgi:hypothetical protein
MRLTPPPSSAAKPAGEMIFSPDLPGFVSEIIERGLWPMAGRELLFTDIFETSKANDFGFVSAVDSDEVSVFVSRVESSGKFGDCE